MKIVLIQYLRIKACNNGSRNQIYKLKWGFLAFILAFCLHFNSSAQSAPIKIENSSSTFSLFHWTTENGLPQNHVRSICRDRSGFLWISTYDGLSRFDGKTFSNYDEGNINGLNSSIFLEMFNDEEGNIWFSTTEEIGKIANGKIKTTFQSKEQNPELLKIGLHLFVKGKASVFSIDQSENRANDAQSLSSFDIVCHGSPCLLSNDDGLYACPETMQLNFLGKFNNHEYLGSNIMRATDKTGKSKLFQFDLDTITPFEFNLAPYRFNEKNAVSIHQSLGYTIIENKDSLFIYYNAENLLSDSKNVLNIRNVTSTYIDDNGQIFLGTYGQGVFLFNPKRIKSYHTTHLEQAGNGQMIYLSELNRIYIDGGCGSLLEINENLDIIRENKVKSCPWTMLFDFESNLWVNGQLENAEESSYQHESLLELIDRKNICSVFEHEKTIYVGTTEGIYFCDQENAGFIPNTQHLKGVYMFYVNQHNDLLFCSDHGVGYIKEDTAEISFFENLGGQHDIRSIYQDKEGYYWVGSSKDGLSVLVNDNLFRFPFGDGRLNKNVWSIVEDDFGYLWMNSNQGIYRANREELLSFAKGELSDFRSMHFTEADGLESSEGNSRTQNKAFKDNNGNIWFSMITGPCIIDPSCINETDEYPIILDYIEVDGIRIHPNKPIIPADFNQVEFAFAQSNRSNENASYVYKLGDEMTWHTIGNEKFVSFSELTHGNYELKIKKLGSENTLNVPFTIQANFYEKDTFKYLIVMLLSGTIFFSIFLLWRNSRRIKARKKKQDAELKNLELMALQSQMNPHFVFNCLNSISSLYTSGNEHAANLYMSKFSSLLRIILEHVQKRLITLNEDLEMFELYITLERLQFDEPFDFELNVDPELSRDTILIPSMVIHTFIENAIKHGLKPLKNKKGKLIISVDKQEHFTRVRIEDNGIGYQNSIKEKKSKLITHYSHGIKNTVKRIELINQINDSNISAETSNLWDVNGESLGTLVTILFPNIKEQSNEDNRN